MAGFFNQSNLVSFSLLTNQITLKTIFVITDLMGSFNSNWCDRRCSQVRAQAMLLGGLGSLGEEKQNLCLQTLMTTGELSSREGFLRDIFHSVNSQVS